jgi:2-alkyl-3-oxoalkanoate reductase
MRILITGAAGLIGSELCAQLAARKHSIVALAHRNPVLVANDGRGIVARAWAASGPPESGEIAIVQADVSQPGLRLLPHTARDLAGQVDLIIHCAAITAFRAPDHARDAVNVAGTANVLALFPSVPLLYVSTAYVCGLKEGSIAEAARDSGFGFANDYERSKAAAEALILAEGRAGRDVAIARPSAVVGAHGTGVIRSFDNFHAAFRLLMLGYVPALPVAPNASLDLVPIDHVVGGLVDLVEYWPVAVGGIFHLTSGCPIAIFDLHDAMRRAVGDVPVAFVSPEQFLACNLSPRQEQLYALAVKPLTGYFSRDPRFVSERLTALSGRRCPVVDAAALDNLFGYAKRSGALQEDPRYRMSG